MKKTARFSKNQNPWLVVFILILVTLPFYLIGAFAAYVSDGIGTVIGLFAFYGFCLLLSIILMIVYRYLFGVIVVDESGISIRTKKGKVLKFIKWEDVRVFTVTKRARHGERYLTISTNKDLPWYRTTFGGVYYTMCYEQKTTITFPADDSMIYFCRVQLEPYGLTITEVVNRNVPSR